MTNNQILIQEYEALSVPGVLLLLGLVFVAIYVINKYKSKNR